MVVATCHKTRRGGRRARGLQSLESLERRQLLATLALQSAAVRPDGRIVELRFSGPDAGPGGQPDWMPAAAAGLRLTGGDGAALEPLGTVVSPNADGGTTWTASFLASDPTRVFTFGSPVRFAAPEGLLRDARGNTTAAFSVDAENGSLVDADGFTTDLFERGDGGVTLYVSSSRGDDSRGLAAAQDPATPLRSPQKALQLLRQGGKDRTGSAVRLLRGDTFDGNIMLTLSGQDPQHPMVLEDYWYNYGGTADPGTRPLIQADWSRGVYVGLRDQNGPETTPHDNVVVRRLAFQAVNRDGGNVASSGLRLMAGGRGWTIDDISVDNFSTNIVIQGYYGTFQDLTLLRSVITDAHLQTEQDGGHAQGLFAKDVTEGLLLSQNAFDRNGRTTADMSGRDIFSHNIYLQSGQGPATVWGNFLRSGGSHGIQMRSGGILAYNYFGRNAIAGYVDAPGGAATRNVVELAEDISPSLVRGFGLSVGTRFGPALAAALEFNVVVNDNSSNPRPRGLLVGGEGASDGIIDPILSGVVRNNTVYAAGVLAYEVSSRAPAGAVRVSANVVGGSDVAVAAWEDPQAPGWWGWLDAETNVFGGTNPSRLVQIDNRAMSLDGWRGRTGEDPSTVQAQPLPARPRASLGDFGLSVGGPGTEAAFAAALRGRQAGVWDPWTDVVKLYTFYAQAYRPTNLATTGAGPFDYYGAGDYRPGTPRLVPSQALTGTSSAAADLTTRSNRNLTFTVDRVLPDSQLALLRDGQVVASTSATGSVSVQLTDAGPVPNGLHVYAVRQTIGGVTTLGTSTTVSVDTTLPAAPTTPPATPPTAPATPPTAPPTVPAPQLAAGQDTGADPTDRLTRNNQDLAFLANRSADPLRANSRLDLLRDGLIVATVMPGDTRTSVRMTDPGPVSDGPHVYVLQRTAGPQVVRSAALTVTVDATAPDAAAPELQTQTTRSPSAAAAALARQRTFMATASDPTDRVELLRRSWGSTGPYQVVASRVGSGLLLDSVLLAAGRYDYVIRVTDLAGNKATSVRRQVLLV